MKGADSRKLAANRALGVPAWHYISIVIVLLLELVRCFGGTAQPIEYVVNLTSRETHTVRVTMTIPIAAAGTEIQIPTWNCLYQIRDFVKNVEDMKGECDGAPVELSRADLNTWRGPNRDCSNLTFRYSVYANTEGPFDSILNDVHAFLNPAMVLFYLPHERSRAIHVHYELPSGWKIATFLRGEGDTFDAANYDALADSPVEAGNFQEYSFSPVLNAAGKRLAGGNNATIRVVIDADAEDYSAGSILHSLQRITTEEVELMQDLPFSRYTFILHFPRDAGSTGGMEHRDGTAITLPASAVSSGSDYLESLVAHEFFHAWNVKRVRPQPLEPVNYISGNDTRDLWFCEGVTNTYGQLALLRAGLLDKNAFYIRLADAMETLEQRSARRFQSVEMAGREAWLEKYSDYTAPNRSISYYNKGELLGYLLDLAIRHASQNQAGLDDVMRRLNEDFARQSRYYTLSDFRFIVAQLAPALDIERFLSDYVRGTRELDYSTYFGYAGLHVEMQRERLPHPGFMASQNQTGSLQVDSVEAGSDAQRAGLRPGDIVVVANGTSVTATSNSSLPSWGPGQEVTLQVVRDGATRIFTFHVGVQEQVSIQLREDPRAQPDQVRVREGWLRGYTVSHPEKP